MPTDMNGIRQDAHDVKETRSGGAQGVALVRLLTWTSPAFPLGAFSYSHGMETAISDGRIRDRETTLDWLHSLLERGGGWSDAVLLKLGWKAGTDDAHTGYRALWAVNDHALAMAPSAERYLETTQQGHAFLRASQTWPVPLHEALEEAQVTSLALPVIMGAMARQHGIDLQTILAAHLHAFAANLTSAAMRLVPLGQSDGLAVQAALEPVILGSAERAMTAELTDIGSICLHSDIAAMRHETLTTRIFRS